MQMLQDSASMHAAKIPQTVHVELKNSTVKMEPNVQIRIQVVHVTHQKLLITAIMKALLVEN
jgi:hypothetical protein